MKLKSSLQLIFFFLLFLSCTKEDIPVDQRDAFEGNYKGTANFKIPSLSVNQTDQYSIEIFKGAPNSNKITIDGIYSASVNGNSYTYSEFTQTENNPTLGTIVFILNGTGTLIGANLTEFGTVRTVILGVTHNGTWSSNSVKQ